MWIPQLAFRSAETPTYTDVLGLFNGSVPQSQDDTDSVRGISSFAVTSTGTAFCVVSRFRRVRDDIISCDLDAVVKMPFPFTDYETWSREEIIDTLNCFPVQLVGANDEGPYAQTGFNMIQREGSAPESCEYGLAQFLWDSRQVKRLASLPNIFF